MGFKVWNGRAQSMKKLVVLHALLLLAIVSPELGWAQNQAEGRKLYASFCASCHGETGKGDGVAANSLPVKPQDHTNGAIMNQLSDQALADVISKGGGAVGKSNFMPAWGASLNDRQVRDIVAYIRSLAVPSYRP
jgi:mono/diheme cytochrome c family protein